jgi:hypothetical protein
VLNTYPARIPVTGGEILSLWLQTSAGCYFSAAEGNSVRYRSGGPYPEPSAGEVFPTNIEQTFARLNVSAVVEPDCDADGFGDETQDPNLFGESCPPKGRSVSLDANKNKVKKKKKARLSGHLESAEQACEAGQAVELQRKRPKQTTFTTFAQLQTDTQGNFSLKKKLKKTTEFRVQVPETAACDDGLSNTEKVKVKKNK